MHYIQLAQPWRKSCKIPGVFASWNFLMYYSSKQLKPTIEGENTYGTGKEQINCHFCTINKDHVPASFFFDANISLTIEIECDGKKSFLDTLVTRRNCTIAVDVYRKPTHTDRYLDYNSHQDNKHKAMDWALNLRNSSEGKKPGLNRAHSALESNGYPSKFIKNIQSNETRLLTVLSPRELVETFFKMVEASESHKSFASLHTLKA